MISFFKRLFAGSSKHSVSRPTLSRPVLKQPQRVHRPVVVETVAIETVVIETVAVGLDRRLIRACLGDKGKAQRLIDYELRRKPGLSVMQAADAALDRLESDRR